jgi:hypothetical protein
MLGRKAFTIRKKKLDKVWKVCYRGTQDTQGEGRGYNIKLIHFNLV